MIQSKAILQLERCFLMISIMDGSALDPSTKTDSLRDILTVAQCRDVPARDAAADAFAGVAAKLQRELGPGIKPFFSMPLTRRTNL